MEKLFYDQLLRFLETKACVQLYKKKKPSSEYLPFAQLLKNLKKKQDLSTLEKLIEKYHDLEREEDPALLELALMNDFSSKELKRVRTIPKILRGLPRLFQPNKPSISKVHPHFSTFRLIKQKVLQKTLYYLYENVKIKEKVDVACLFENEEEKFFLKTLFKSLRKKLSSFEVSLVSIGSPKNDKDSIVLSKDKKISLKNSTKSLLSYVRSVPLIFQLFHPATYIDSFFEKTKKEDRPHYEALGSYGQLEEEAFFPTSPFFSLGLHFLELGVLTLEKKDPTISSIPYFLCSHTSIKDAVFYTNLLIEIKKKEIHDLKIEYFSKSVLDAVYENLLAAKNLEIKTIKTLHNKKVVQKKKVSHSGKDLFLAYQSDLDYTQKTELFASSQEPIGISSDIAFSYAVSYDKTYVYSRFDQKSCLIKDLIALAKNRLAKYPKAIVYLENLYQLQLQYHPKKKDEYVSEEYFQLSHLDSFEEIQKRLSLLINTREVVTGLRVLNSLISNKYSANSYLTGLIKRAYLHNKHPELQTLETQVLSNYLEGSTSFLDMLKQITSSIKKYI